MENPMMRFLRWNGRNEAYLNVVDTLGHALWDNTIFMNDPDVVFVREENCTLTENQKLLIAGINRMFGSQFMYSDDPGLAGEPEKLLTQKIFDFINKYDEEEFGIKQTSEDIYEIFSKSGKYKGEVNLKTTHLKMSERE